MKPTQKSKSYINKERDIKMDKNDIDRLFNVELLILLYRNVLPSYNHDFLTDENKTPWNINVQVEISEDDLCYLLDVDDKEFLRKQIRIVMNSSFSYWYLEPEDMISKEVSRDENFAYFINYPKDDEVDKAYHALVTSQFNENGVYSFRLNERVAYSSLTMWKNETRIRELNKKRQEEQND